MNLIDIVKNAPEGAQRYLSFSIGGVEYYAFIDGNKCYFNPNLDKWIEASSENFDRATRLPKIKTSYAKVEDSIWDLKEDFESGELYYYQGGEYHKITKEPQLLCHYKHQSIYRRFDKIIDEREEFGRKMNELINSHRPNHDNLFDTLFDAGCRFID